MTNDTCPTCGQPVQVVGSDEGTQHDVAAEQSALLRHLHDQERTIEHLVQANHALHDELATARARIAALENQLDELGEGAYRAAAERDNRYVPQLHEWKDRAERAEAELARVRPVVEAAQGWHVAAQHYDAAMSSRDYGAADLADAELNAATERLIAAVAALDAAREEPR